MARALRKRSSSPSPRGRKKPRRTQEERSSETTAKILAATRDCIFELGYSGATMSAIARRAGVTRGALQHHYGSRSELLKALIDYFFVSLPKLKESTLHDDPARNLEEFLTETFRVYGTRIAVSIMQLRIGAQAEPKISDGIEAKFAALDPTREEIWNEMFERAGLSAREANLMREVVVAILRGLAVRQAYLKTEFGGEAEFALVSSMIAHYLEKAGSTLPEKRRAGVSVSGQKRTFARG